MKVLRIVGGLNPLAGGPPAAAVNSLLAVARQGCQTRLVLPARDVEAVRADPRLIALVDAGVEVEALRFGYPQTEYLRSVGFSPAVATHVRALMPRYDVVHVEGAWQYTTFAGVRIAKRYGRPVVLTPHETLTAFDMRQGRSVIQRRLKGPIKRYYVRSVDSVVFSSRIELRDSAPETPPPGWVVIPHPVYDERSGPVAGRRFDLDPRAPFRLGYLGRLHPKKNVDRLLDALAELPPRVTLAIAGDGPAKYAATLRERARTRGLAERVSWLGFIEGDRKDAFLRGIDLLTMPSAYECFGMAVVEGMAAGTPVLVTPDTGVADVVRLRRAGVVVPPETPAIVRAITDLVDDRSRLPDLSRNAATAAAEAFSFRAHGAALVQLYARLMGAERLGGRPRALPPQVRR